MPKLTEDLIRRFNLGGRDEALLRDTQLTGFALRVRRRADGSLSREFLVVHDYAGPDGARKRRKVNIGQHPTWTAEKARHEAQSMLQALDRGEDPAAKRAATKAQPTFAALIAAFDADHIAHKKPKTQADYRGRIERNLRPEFKTRRVADITPLMVRDFMRRKRTNPIDANRSLAVLSKMMSFAIEQEMRTDNPCKGVRRYTETPRDQWLDEQDLPKFLAVLNTRQGPAAECVRFLTLTGWRITEALSLDWSMVDLSRNIARLPDTKTGAQDRALSADAAAILAARPRGAGYVFWKRSPLMRLGYRQVLDLLRDICTEAEIAPITPHVLRHSAATWTAIAGAEAHELREAFGWKTLAMTGRYVAKAKSLGRRGVERAADAMRLAAQVGGK